jgi:uncharacterized protein (TIGR02246 family)
MSGLSDHDQIRHLLAAYCHTCDDGQFDRFAQLFTEDAQFTVMGGTRTGREEIKAWMEASLPPEIRGKHIISEPAIVVDDAGATASVRTDYAFIGRAGDGLGVTSTGRYLDHLVRDADDQWRIASRRIVFLGEPE